MGGQTVLSTTLIAFTFLHFAAVTSITFPTQNQFITELLGGVESNFETIALQFKFNGNVTPDDIRIIQYFSNGTNTSSVLTNLMSGSSRVALDVGKPIIFIAHGYTGAGNISWISEMANAYHEIEITNTFAIDWAHPAKQNYLASAEATKKVGQLVAEWLSDLQKHENFNFKDFQLVGHSLGGHLCGFLGKTVFELTQVKIGRISGLDVAGPLFEYPIKVDESNRLSSTDADLVEAYHTNKMFLGFLSAVGKQDFYVNNGGPIQPACTNINVLTAIKCSHEFVHEFFTKSITNNGYGAKKCRYSELGLIDFFCSNDEVFIMGQHNNETDTSGVFYGNTDNDGGPVAIA